MSKASNHKTTLGKEEIIHFEKHPTGEKTLLRHFDAGEIPEFFDDTKPFKTPPKNNHSIIGVTADLYSRIMDHKNHIYKNSFTDRYNCVFCIYYEHYPTIQQAIARLQEKRK